VVIDKVGFSPIDDVLTNARRELVSRSGRDGFKEIVVAQAATSLAQAAGRLIRSTEDKGVVAILDPRIRSKSYGKTLLASLPDFRIFSDKTIVTEALTRLTGGMSSVGKKPDIQLLQANPSGGLPNAKPKPSASSKLVRSSYKRNIGKNK
jgi:ATP-dependent DNA helicase DinG